MGRGAVWRDLGGNSATLCTFSVKAGGERSAGWEAGAGGRALLRGGGDQAHLLVSDILSTLGSCLGSINGVEPGL